MDVRMSFRWLCLIGVPVLLLPAVLPRKATARRLGRVEVPPAGRPAPTSADEARRLEIQAIVDEFRTKLPVDSQVRASFVPFNPLVVSVARVNGEDAFEISIEARFAAELTDDEIRAVVAHELGHVWIFTHHPYLHTEELANSIAMRLVSRDTLDAVYNKVWTATRQPGNLVYLPKK
jgi:hypothetical protein